MIYPLGLSLICSASCQKIYSSYFVSWAVFAHSIINVKTTKSFKILFTGKGSISQDWKYISNVNKISSRIISLKVTLLHILFQYKTSNKKYCNLHVSLPCCCISRLSLINIPLRNWACNNPCSSIVSTFYCTGSNI